MKILKLRNAKQHTAKAIRIPIQCSIQKNAMAATINSRIPAINEYLFIKQYYSLYSINKKVAAPFF